VTIFNLYYVLLYHMFVPGNG